ncbi:MAG TPA: hypothetical protein VH420_08270 [Gaiellaceae bacterium]
MVFLSTGAVVVAYGLLVALVIEPPLLGWIGFAIVSTVILCLGALAPLAFERTRVNPLRPAHSADRQTKLLVVADPHCDESALSREVLARLGDVAAVHVIVPVRVSHLHFLTDDENREWHYARQSMLRTVTLLREQAANATGSVGSDKPLESMTDALGSFPATRVLLALPPEQDSYWLERGLLAKARRLTRVPVAQVVVPSAATPTVDRQAGRFAQLSNGRPT